MSLIDDSVSEPMKNILPTVLIISYVLEIPQNTFNSNTFKRWKEWVEYSFLVFFVGRKILVGIVHFV
jgi:hypothetical protein